MTESSWRESLELLKTEVEVEVESILKIRGVNILTQNIIKVKLEDKSYIHKFFCTSHPLENHFNHVITISSSYRNF